MNGPVLLDGSFVDPKSIDPAKHSFLGMFRSPTPPDARGYDAVACPCNRILDTFEGTAEHWRLGHFDVPQYVTLEKKP